MKNNELFIDTMDKINSLAKSRGFTNGIEWAKAAAKVNKISVYVADLYELSILALFTKIMKFLCGL